ncbi:hypothetical protein FRUB_05551 [Fimbriiglobus ruber]|uniref:Uncharacterized protein n=1 Tax=Fimbriiglobus ruber TaxID=1908690 RepID=A0A225DDN6_9BACT|nr:hypothetical protein FRUB_05551 [Fimbriiglobus ruber]
MFGADRLAGRLRHPFRVLDTRPANFWTTTPTGTPSRKSASNGQRGVNLG